MNTLQLAERLGRNLAVADPALLPADAALDVLTAINAGVQEFYREAPSIYKRTTLSHTFRAPEEVSMTFTAQYSHETTANVFTAAMRGCTLRIAGIAPDNEITGENTVLDEYPSATLAATGTVYYDAAPVESVIEKITGPVRFHDGTGQIWNSLSHCPGDYSARSHSAFRQYSPGTPTWYRMDAVGASQGGNPEFLLRIGPFPAAAATVRFEAELGPRRITFVELQNPVRVPVPDQRVEEMLLPLCEAQLTKSRFWRADLPKGAVLDAGQAALFKMRHIPARIGGGHNRVGTPVGF